jgi:hypothetical protein
MDARNVGRRDPGRGRRGVLVQRVNRRTLCRDAACRVSFPSLGRFSVSVLAMLQQFGR